MSDEIETKGIYQDSWTIGTPATGGSIKIYFNALNLEETEKKLKNAFKIRSFLQQLGGI